MKTTIFSDNLQGKALHTAQATHKRAVREALRDYSAGLNMEYLNCGNGYYYMLINREKFIGIDID